MGELVRIVTPDETQPPDSPDKPGEFSVRIQICYKDFDEYLDVWVTEHGAKAFRKEFTDARNAFVTIKFWKLEPVRYIHTEDGMEPLNGNQWLHGDKVLRTKGIISVDFLD